MIDPTLSVTLAIASLAGLAMVTFAGLAGWRGWLSLKQQELVLTTRPQHRQRHTNVVIE